MSRLVWDLLLEREYENGLDRAVLYIQDDTVAWNGLTGVNEAPQGGNTEPLYVDGQIVRNDAKGENLSLSISAYTFPDEFEKCCGIAEVDGVEFGGQNRVPFDLTYRTLVGNAVNPDEGYKIHLLYGCYAVPSTKGYDTQDAEPDAMTLTWSAATVAPEAIPGYKASAHLIVDTRLIPRPEMLAEFEDMLYGTETTPPAMPSPSDVAFWFGDWVYFRVTVHEDGTWTAKGPDEFFSFPTPSSFAINVPSVTYLDADTYTIESFN